MTALQLRDEVIKARAAHMNGTVTIDQLYAIVDQYIDAIMAYYKKTGKRKARPSRSYIIRAL